MMLLQRVFTDSTPLSLMQGNKDTIKHAADEKAKAKKEEAEAAKIEDEESKNEAKYTKEAKTLGAKDKALTEKAAKAAAKATKDRLAATKKALDHDKAEIAKETEAGKKAEADEADNQKALAKKRGEIADTYKKGMKKIHDDEAAANKAFGEEKNAADKKFEEEFKSNHAKAAAAEGAIKEEAKNNKAEAKKEQDDIKKAFKKKEDAAAKVKADNEKEDKDREELEAHRHGAANAAIQKKLEADKAQNDKDDAAAAADQAEADAAEKHYEDTMEEDKEEDQARDDKGAAQAKLDGEMKSCAMDGSECELDAEDGTATCEKVIGHGGDKFYVADDMVTCTTKKPDCAVGADCEDIGGANDKGGNWAHIPDPVPPAPAPKPDKKCKELRMALSKATGLHGLGWEADGSDSKEGAKTCPCEAIACAHGVDADKQKTGLIAYYKMAEACPDWVMPGTCKDDGLGYGAACIKVTKDDVSMVRQQIESMPVYAAFGTNNRFPAGAKADVCRMVKSTLKGWFAGAGDELIQGNDKTIAHAKGKKEAAEAEEKVAAEAKKLGAEDKKLAKEAEESNRKAAEKEEKDAEHAADEVEKANADSAKREKDAEH